MAKFDVADAALAGFGVLRRKPLAVLAWAVVVYILAVLPAIGLVGALLTLVRDLPAMAQEPDDARQALHQMMGLELSLLMGHPFATVGSLLVRVLLAAAVIRAVVTPKDDRFFYLRFGRGELMLLLVTIVAVILMMAAICVYLLVLAALVVAAHSVNNGLAAVAGVVGALGLGVSIIVLLLRFSLIAPASVMEKQFRLFESWRLTKGHAGSLLLVAILNFVVAMLVQTVLSALLFGIGGVALMAAGGLPRRAESRGFPDHAPRSDHAPVAALDPGPGRDRRHHRRRLLHPGHGALGLCLQGADGAGRRLKSLRRLRGPAF